MTGWFKPGVIQLRMALIVLLISMQGYSLAHELDLGSNHDSSACVVCSAGSHHNAAVHTHQQAAIEHHQLLLVSSSPVSEYSRAPAQIPEARAPPSPL